MRVRCERGETAKNRELAGWCNPTDPAGLATIGQQGGRAFSHSQQSGAQKQTKCDASVVA